MKKYLILITLLSSVAAVVSGQTQPYGVIDTADLKMTSCDFEKDANAEVLFDKAEVYPGPGLTMNRHIRIKIYNDFGKKYANVRLFYRAEFLESNGIAGVDGETMNLNDKGEIVITHLEKNQIFTGNVVKNGW